MAAHLLHHRSLQHSGLKGWTECLQACAALVGVALMLTGLGVAPTLGPAAAQSLNARSLGGQALGGQALGSQMWRTLDHSMIAALLVRRTLVRADGSRLYLLPSGSAYREQGGYLSYLRWGVVANQLCLQDKQRLCYGVQRVPAGLRLVGKGGVEDLALLDGDPGQLVWRYGLSLRTALAQGQITLGRITLGQVTLGQVTLGQPRVARRSSAAPARQDPVLAQRSLPFSPKTAGPAGQPRFGRSSEPVAKDGTVGRFAIRPQGRPSILPQYAQPAPVTQPAPAQDSALAPSPQPTEVTRPAQAAQVQAAPLLFSPQVDKDPGCYAQLQHCRSRCRDNGSMTYPKSPGRCARNCLDTYICTR